MKTVEEFYREFSGSEALQEELKAAYDEMLKAFLTKHGCEPDAEKFLQLARVCSEGAVTDEDVTEIAGGAMYHQPFVKPTVVPLL